MNTMDAMMLGCLLWLFGCIALLAWDNARDERRHQREMEELRRDLDAANPRPRRGLITDSEARP